MGAGGVHMESPQEASWTLAISYLELDDVYMEIIFHFNLNISQFYCKCLCIQYSKRKKNGKYFDLKYLKIPSRVILSIFFSLTLIHRSYCPASSNFCHFFIKRGRYMCLSASCLASCKHFPSGSTQSFPGQLAVSFTFASNLSLLKAVEKMYPFFLAL